MIQTDGDLRLACSEVAVAVPSAWIPYQRRTCLVKEEFTRKLSLISTNNPSVTDISICPRSSPTVQSILQVLSTAHPLVFLSKAYLSCNFYDQDLSSLISIFLDDDSLPTLKSLSITSHDLAFRPLSINALSKGISQNRTLVELDLWDNQLNDDHFQSIADSLSVNSSLQVLMIADNNLSSKSGPLISGILKHNSTLTKLDFSRTELGEFGAIAIAESLASNTVLASLILKLSGIDGLGIPALFRCLQSNTTLTELDLHGNRIRLEEMGVFCEQISTHNNFLLNLGLSGCLSLPAVDLFISAIQDDTRLVELSLDTYDLKTTDHLIRVLSRNTTLQILRLSCDIPSYECFGTLLASNSTLMDLSIREVSNQKQKTPSLTPIFCALSLQNTSLRSLRFPCTRESSFFEDETNNPQFAPMLMTNSSLTFLSLAKMLKLSHLIDRNFFNMKKKSYSLVSLLLPRVYSPSELIAHDLNLRWLIDEISEQSGWIYRQKKSTYNYHVDEFYRTMRGVPIIVPYQSTLVETDMLTRAYFSAQKRDIRLKREGTLTDPTEMCRYMQGLFSRDLDGAVYDVSGTDGEERHRFSSLESVTNYLEQHILHAPGYFQSMKT